MKRLLVIPHVDQLCNFLDNIRPSEMKTLITLAVLAHGALDGAISLSLPEIALHAGLSQPTTSRCIRDLEIKNMLHVDHRGHGPGACIKLRINPSVILSMECSREMLLSIKAAIRNRKKEK